MKMAPSFLKNTL